MTNLASEIQKLKETKAEVANNFAEYIKDKEIPLETRWTAFIENGDILPVELYGDGYLDWLSDNMTMYDDFYVDRGQTYLYSDMWERLTEILYDGAKNMIAENNITQETVDEWREKVLASGYGGFEYDW